MKGKLHTVVAGQRKDELELSVWKTLAELGYVEQKSVSSVGFCRAEDGTLLVVLPKAFSHPAEKHRIETDATYKREQIFRLIRVFRRVQQDTRFSQAYIDSTAATGSPERSLDPVLDGVEAAIRLRADYRRNGFWLPRRKGKLWNMPSHPISWGQTIKNSAPVLADDSIFFLDTVHEKRIRDSANSFYRLHVHILREIFLLTGDRHFLSALPKFDDSALQPILRNPKKYLRQFRREIFTDRGRMLLSFFEAYLSTSSLKLGARRQTDDCLSYTASFENLWEFILAELFKPNATPKFQFGTGRWVSWPTKTERSGITPEADLVTEQPALTILDAKDYRIFNGSPLMGYRLGHPDDHYKQVIYRTLFESGGKPVTNILAFPAVNLDSLFVLNGCHYWTSIAASPVYEICVDYDMAVRHWLGETRLNVVAEFEKLLAQVRTLQASLATQADGNHRR